jgi:hypothetical protein
LLSYPESRFYLIASDNNVGNSIDGVEMSSPNSNRKNCSSTSSSSSSSSSSGSDGSGNICSSCQQTCANGSERKPAFGGGFGSSNNNNNNNNNNNGTACGGGGGAGSGSASPSYGGVPPIHVTAKVLFGSVSAISALNAERKKKT